MDVLMKCLGFVSIAILIISPCLISGNEFQPSQHQNGEKVELVHERMRRASNDSKETLKDEIKNNSLFYGVAAGAGLLFVILIISALICCCCIHKKMENKRKVAPEKNSPGGPNNNQSRAKGNWGVLAGRMNQGQIRNNNNPTFNNQNRRMSHANRGGTTDMNDVTSGSQPSWQAGASTGWPGAKTSQSQLSGISNGRQFQNNTGRLAQLNAQLRDDADKPTYQNEAKQGQVSWGEEEPTYQNAPNNNDSGQPKTPSDVILNNKPRQPPTWQSANVRNGTLPPLAAGGGKGLNSRWQPQQNDLNQGHYNGNYQQDSYNSNNRNGQNTSTDKPSWKSILFDL